MSRVLSLPPLLHLVIEVLSTLVRPQKEIIGIENMGRSYTIILYADDNVFSLQTVNFIKAVNRFGGKCLSIK